MNEKINFNIANINRCTTAEGPYKRLAIWFQGCDILCKNCCNEQLQQFIPANIVCIEDLVEIITQSKLEFDIEGITLLGGEPTLQTKSLIHLCKKVKSMGLGIILFSGILRHQISTELLSNVDLLIDGPYIDSKKEKIRPWVGSINQKFHYLTSHYNNSIENKSHRNVNINVGNTVLFNGDVILNL